MKFLFILFFQYVPQLSASSRDVYGGYPHGCFGLTSGGEPVYGSLVGLMIDIKGHSPASQIMMVLFVQVLDVRHQLLILQIIFSRCSMEPLIID